MKKSLIYLFFLPVFFFASCDDIIIENTPENVFEVFWRTMNENYVFFEEKGIDWDSIHRIYAPKARRAKDDTDLLNIFRNILPLFRDGHLWIQRKDSQLRSIPLVSFAVISNDVDKLLADGFEVVHSERELLILTHKERRVVYFKLNTFNYSGGRISTRHPERLLNNLDFANGLIIDLSNNMGGNLNFVYNFVSAFFTDRKKVLYTQEKTGRGRNDFGDKMPVYLQGRAYVPYDVPLVVLASSGTYSAGNVALYMLDDLRNITVIGRPTHGGGGAQQIVVLPNGWVFGFPSNRIFSPSGRLTEFRFEPDIYIDVSDRSNEFRDAILGVALEYLTPNP